MDTKVLCLILFGVSRVIIGQQLYCPGTAAIDCNGSSPIVWDGTAFDGECSINAITIQNDVAIGDIFSCGDLIVTIIDVATVTNVITTTNINSRLSFNAQPSLSGLTIECRSANNPPIVSQELLVPDIPSPSISIIQDSILTLTVTFSVTDTRCAAMYLVEVNRVGSNDPPIIRSSTSPSVSVLDLDLCRSRYSVVSYVQSSSGLRGGGSSSLQYPSSNVQAVTNVEVTSSTTLSWIQPTSNAPTGCITGYIISWPGGEATTSGTSTSVDVSTLDNFPFCQTVSLTVTPNTPLGPLSSGTDLSNARFDDPDFVEPILIDTIANEGTFFSVSSTSQTGFDLNVNWQDISSSVVPIRQYGFVETGQGECIPTKNTVGSSVMLPVPGAESGDNYTVCVRFINNECTASASINIIVPIAIFANPRTTAGDTYISVTVDVLQPSPVSGPLFIYSTINPPHAGGVLVDYPPSTEYTVIFNGLAPSTLYTFTVGTVSRNNSQYTIGLLIVGSVCTTGTPFSTEATVALSVVLTFVLTMVVVVIISVLSVLVVNKCRRSEKENQTETEMRSPSPIYEEPDDVRHDPQTQENVAYGHVELRQ